MLNWRSTLVYYYVEIILFFRFSQQQQMKEATEKRNVLEKQHAEALAQLKEKQQALKNDPKDKKAITDTIDGLQVGHL